MNNSKESTGSNDLANVEKIDVLESRISKIESVLKYIAPDLFSETLGEEQDTERAGKSEDSILETNLVEVGLSWLSTIIFILGVLFLMTYIRSIGYPLLGSLIGYVAAGILLVFTYIFRLSFSRIIHFLNASGLILIYLVTLRLHYFTEQPVIENSVTELILLTISLCIFIGYAVIRKNEAIAFLSIILLLITGIIIDTTYVTFTLVTIAAVISFFYFVKFTWWRQLIATIFMVYLTHLIWLLGNPFMGHELKIVEAHQNNIVFLFIYGFILSSTIFIAKKDEMSETVHSFISVLNAMNFSVILIILTFVFYKENYTGIYLSIATLCLAFSVILKYKTEQLFPPAFYACCGFIALSISLYGYAQIPDWYYWLVLQSLVVVSMALWFRSKLIVVVNTLLFVILLAMYLITSDSINTINFVFAIGALVTARILNWKKERLTIKTEAYRNIYLIIAFGMVLFTLNKAIPTQYITLSWMGAAVLYLFLGIMLKNRKYRWMSFLTLIFTGGHLLLVDMAQMEMGYKVIAFLVFAAITIGLTLFYSKSIKKREESGDGETN
jgi:hypothetical protein